MLIKFILPKGSKASLVNIFQAVKKKENFHVFLSQSIKSDKKVLILSIGGGNDYIGAYSIAKLVSKYHPKSEVFFASSVELSKSYKPLIKLKPHLYAIDDFSPEFDFKIKNHSIRLIAHGIKNEQMNLPFFVSVNENNPEQRKQAYQELFDEIEPDYIFTVDNGGDSITGGFEGANGFDQSNLKSLVEMGNKLHHLVLGPGCDGESSIEDFERYIMQVDNFRGIFDIREAIELIYNNVRHNPEVMLQTSKRWSTIRIIIEAIEKIKLGLGDEFFTIPRHDQNQKIRYNFLQSLLVFEYN